MEDAKWYLNRPLRRTCLNASKCDAYSVSLKCESIAVAPCRPLSMARTTSEAPLIVSPEAKTHASPVPKPSTCFRYYYKFLYHQVKRKRSGKSDPEHSE